MCRLQTDSRVTSNFSTNKSLFRAITEITSHFQGYQEPLQSLTSWIKGKKSTDTKPPIEDKASRSGEDTGSVELSKASLEANAEIVASKLRVDPLRASAKSLC